MNIIPYVEGMTLKISGLIIAVAFPWAPFTKLYEIIGGAGAFFAVAIALIAVPMIAIVVIIIVVIRAIGKRSVIQKIVRYAKKKGYKAIWKDTEGKYNIHLVPSQQTDDPIPPSTIPTDPAKKRITP